MSLTTLQIEVLKTVKRFRNGDNIDLDTGKPIVIPSVPMPLIIGDLLDRADIDADTSQGAIGRAVRWLVDNGYLAGGPLTVGCGDGRLGVAIVPWESVSWYAEQRQNAQRAKPMVVAEDCMKRD